MSVHIIVGKNFGDEGKGLATDYFASLAQKDNRSCIVIRHNGGAQAGHTVDLPDKRFVFHQLSSGSFRMVDTFWADSFLPDLYKLPEEMNTFKQLNHSLPVLYASGKCRCVTVDDVLLNMAIEAARGDARHGSCGMGINEAVERSLYKDFLLPLETVKALSSEGLAKELKRIRSEYLPYRLESYKMSLDQMGEYGELLHDNLVPENAAEIMCRSAELVSLIEESQVSKYEKIIFEGAQGLLLDEQYLSYAPHLTSSRTGAHNPAQFCRQFLSDRELELVYVTRSYVTRHGAGPLPYEDKSNYFFKDIIDVTNLPNAWQGTLRYALHGTTEEFIEPLLQDRQEFHVQIPISLMITHLNETNRTIYSTQGNIPVERWITSHTMSSVFSKYYFSDTQYADDISCQR